MKILVNYANDKYKKTQQINSLTGKYIGKFDKVYSYGPEDIDSTFREENNKILNEDRGNGLWLWKPYFIYKTLELCEEGDIVFYCDSGSFFLRSIDNLVNSLNKNEKIWVSDVPLLEVNFTKPECFEQMGCDRDDIKYTNQVQGTFFMAVCCAETKEFVKKWLGLCKDYKLLAPKTAENNPEYVNHQFLSHREDQSILSLLCKMNGLKTHLDPSQRGKFQEIYYSPYYPFVRTDHKDSYKPIVFLHKFPKINVVGCLKIALKMHYKRLKYRKVRDNRSNCS